MQTKFFVWLETASSTVAKTGLKLGPIAQSYLPLALALPGDSKIRIPGNFVFFPLCNATSKVAFFSKKRKKVFQINLKNHSFWCLRPVLVKKIVEGAESANFESRLSESKSKSRSKLRLAAAAAAAAAAAVQTVYIFFHLIVNFKEKKINVSPHWDVFLLRSAEK